MTENDIIRISDLELIAEKINELPRPYDLQAYELNLTEREQRIMTALVPIGKVALFNDLKRLQDKINNHHHVALSVSDGIEFRENGSRVKPVRQSGTGMGTARTECSV